MASIQLRKETGLLIIDFYFRGERCREQTALTDTAANRKKVQKVLDRIESEIKAGTFEYARFFPGSKNIRKFDDGTPQPSMVSQSVGDAIGTNVGVRAQSLAGVADTPLFKEFTETWYLEKEVEWCHSANGYRYLAMRR